MKNYQSTFERHEKKYLVTYSQWYSLLRELEQYMQMDFYGKHLITNIYYDTPDWQLIRHSMSKPIYKEKVRIRSYGVPSDLDPVFLELKKKYKGIVYKRRSNMILKDAENFLNDQKINLSTSYPVDTQIINEFQSVLSFYSHLQPAMYLSYERMAYVGMKDSDLRITFDQNILYRTDYLSLKEGSWGKVILPDQHLLMEIKIVESMPIWLASLLSEMKIFPAKFSKYANAYQDWCESERKKVKIKEVEGVSA